MRTQNWQEQNANFSFCLWYSPVQGRQTIPEVMEMQRQYKAGDSVNQAALQTQLSVVRGIQRFSTNQTTGVLTVDYDEAQLSAPMVDHYLSQAGYLSC